MLKFTRHLLAAASFAALALPCTPAFAVTEQITILTGGLKRSAVVVEHVRLKRKLRPVVIVLHGGNGTGARVRKNLGLEDFSPSASAIMVYPDAINGHWPDRAGAEATRDITYLKDLVAKLIADGTADKNRIFLVGSSTGGMMAMRAVCETDLFAGAATLIANMPAELAATCKPPRATAYFTLIGTADPQVPYNGGPTNLLDTKVDIASSDASLAPFAAAAACAKTPPTSTPLADRNTLDGSRVYLDKFNECKAPVVRMRIEGGGHTIPGRWDATNRGQAVGATNPDIDAARVIWDFIKRIGG